MNELRVEAEITLLQALANFRPTGVHGPFRLVNCLRFFNKQQRATPHSMNSLKDTVGEFYDLSRLLAKETEEERQLPLDYLIYRDVYPFVRLEEFGLPVDEFDSLIVHRRENPDSPPSSAHTDSVQSEIPEKKRRGRPPKNKYDTVKLDPNSSGDHLLFDGSGSPSVATPMPAPRKRGRPRKTGIIDTGLPVLGTPQASFDVSDTQHLSDASLTPMTSTINLLVELDADQDAEPRRSTRKSSVNATPVNQSPSNIADKPSFKRRKML